MEKFKNFNIDSNDLESNQLNNFDQVDEVDSIQNVIMLITLPWNCIVLRFGGCLISRTISRVIVGRYLQRFIVSTALVAIISSSPAKSNESVKRI